MVARAGYTGPRRHIVRSHQQRRRQLDPFFRNAANGGLVELPDGQGTNHDFGSDGQTAVRLPGSAQLAFSYSVAVSAEDVQVEVLGGLDFTHPALAADEVWKGVWVEEGKEVRLNRQGAPAGVATIYIIDDIGRRQVIGTATFP